MKISIIMPVYNCEKYLDIAIRSIERQSFHDWELLLIDDGSTDNSGEICEKWGKNDSRISVFHQINRGVSAARNWGLRKADGNYIFFMDADDYISDNFLQDVSESIQRYNADIILVNAKRFFDKDCFKPPEIKLSQNLSEEYLHRLLMCGFVREACFKVCKSSLIGHESFDEKLKSAEDLDYMAEILKNCKTVACTKDSFYYYNKMNMKSITHQNQSAEFFMNNFIAWHHFWENSTAFHWEEMDERLPEYYLAQCMYYALKVLNLQKTRRLKQEDDYRNISLFIKKHIKPFLLSYDTSHRMLIFSEYYYLYETLRLSWLICGGISGIPKTRVIRGACKLYCLNCEMEVLTEKEKDDLKEFVVLIKKDKRYAKLSLGQSGTLWLVSMGLDSLLRFKGKSLLN